MAHAPHGLHFPQTPVPAEQLMMLLLIPSLVCERGLALRNYAGIVGKIRENSVNTMEKMLGPNITTFK
jgi:hypothetical protein